MLGSSERVQPFGGGVPARPALRPIIIALDQDNFYCAVERVLHPALRGMPVGITQKSLLATTSYEARALGVQKLMSIRKAKEICPELILVDGEDLSKYRQFSIRVSRLVNGLTGGGGNTGKGVEKLGMDEVFLDVTSLIYAHMARIWPDNEVLARYHPGFEAKLETSEGHRYFFPLQRPSSEHAAPLRPGFWYALGEANGHIWPKDKGRETDTGSIIVPADEAELESNALYIASHLAAYIRQLISELIGLSSSAGIGHSKLVSKLIGNEHKPNDQTIFLGSHAELQAYLDPLPLRKINGFGSKVIAKLQEQIPSTYRGPVSDDGKAVDSPLTVKQARTLLEEEKFHVALGPRLGAKLWSLLFGVDEDPVHPTPDYPKTISVEDSFALSMSRTFATIKSQTEELLELLIQRLEDELIEEGKWQRYPEQFRMALRLAWNHPGGRDSKSTRLPAFVFETDRTVKSRAKLLLEKVAIGLLQYLLGKSRAIGDEEKFDVYV